MATSGSIIREARLRAGMSQIELGEASGRDRTQIARWERDAVQPSFETLLEIVRACGFDISVDLIAYHPPPATVVKELYQLTPQQRLDRMLERGPGGSGARADD